MLRFRRSERPSRLPSATAPPPSTSSPICSSSACFSLTTESFLYFYPLFVFACIFTLHILLGLLNFRSIVLYVSKFRMADLPGYIRACFQTGKLAMLAILVSGGIVLQILACALYNNWWPMLTVLMYVLLPMPLIFFAGSNTSLMYSESSGWIDAAKFLTGASAIGSIAIPVILKHAGVIGWGAMAMELSSFFVIVFTILCYFGTNEDDGYSMF